MANSKLSKYLNLKEMPKADDKDILAQAKNDGHLGVNVDSENLPPVLRQLSTKLIAYKTEIWVQAQSYFSTFQTNITEAETEHNIDKIRTDLTNKTLHSDGLDLPKVKASLASDYHSFEIQRKNYEKFKKFHGLFLLPKNADPDETRFQMLILIGLFLVEFALNFYMIKSGGEVDFAGGISISLGQTTVNIISCYLLGKVVIGHLLHAQTLAKKILLSLSVSLHVYIIGVINANMGIFRHALVEQGKTGGKFGGDGGEVLGGEVPEIPPMEGIEVLGTFKAFPWDKMSNLVVTDYIVVFMGLVFAVLAFLDGLKSDDPYPGYGHVYRGALKVKKKIIAQVKVINIAWNGCLKRFNVAQTEVSDRALISITTWSMETNSIEQVWDDYKKFINELEEIYEGSLKLYASNYNKFHAGEKVKLKSLLLNKDEFDLEAQFADVAQLHLPDISRKKIEEAKTKIFAKEFAELKKELATLNEKTTKDIHEISDNYRCELS